MRQNYNRRLFLLSSDIHIQLYFYNSVFYTLLQRLTCYSRIKLQKFNLIGEKYIKNKAFSCMLDENRKDELQNLEERNFTIEDDRPTQNLGSIGAVIYVNYGSHLSHSTAN